MLIHNFEISTSCPRSILLPPGVYVEQPSPSLRQNEALRQPQGVHWLLSKSASQSTQLQWRCIHSRVHQRVTGYPPTIQTSGEVQFTHWSEVLYRAQSYIQLEEAMKSSANSSFNNGDDGTKLKPQHGTTPSTTRIANKAFLAEPTPIPLAKPTMSLPGGWQLHSTKAPNLGRLWSH